MHIIDWLYFQNSNSLQLQNFFFIFISLIETYILIITVSLNSSKNRKRKEENNNETKMYFQKKSRFLFTHSSVSHNCKRFFSCRIRFELFLILVNEFQFFFLRENCVYLKIIDHVNLCFGCGMQ